MKQTITFGVIGIVILIGALVFGLNLGGETHSASPAATSTGSSETATLSAPDFTVYSLSGEKVSLSENINSDKSTVIYFMSSTCTTCAKNWKSLSEVYPDYEDDVSFIAVSVDPTDSQEVLEKLAKDRGFQFPSSTGNVQLARDYEVYKQTAKVAIDKDGNQIYRHDGVLSTEEWRDLFESLK